MVRFTMLLDKEMQERITNYQRHMGKTAGFEPTRTAIIRQAIEDFLARKEKDYKK